MIGNVDSVTKSQSGKSWRVKIGNEFYGANFDSKIDTALGKVIDFEWTDGKFGKWLQSWGAAREGSAPTPQAPVAPPSSTSRVSNGDRWWLPFVSNQCHAAIQAGVIKDRATLNQWAKDFKDCAIAVDMHDSAPF